MLSVNEIYALGNILHFFPKGFFHPEVGSAVKCILNILYSKYLMDNVKYFPDLYFHSLQTRAVTICDIQPKSQHSDLQTCVVV